MNRAIFWKTGLTYGVIMGLGFCLYTILMWITQLDTTYLNIGHYLDMAIILWPLAAIFMGIAALIKKGKVSLLERLSLAVLVAAVSELLYSPFLYFYHNSINPSWYEAVLRLQKEKMITQHADPAKIAQSLEALKSSIDHQNHMFNAVIPSVIVIPILMALLSLIFVRNKK